MNLRPILLLAAVVWGSNLTAQQAPDTSRRSDTAARTDWDVDRFFATHVAVDGNVNYYSKIRGTEIGQPDFSKDKNGLSVKQATGLDFGAITLGSLRSLEGQRNSFTSGRYQGARLILDASDFDKALADKQYGVLFYSQTHYPLEGDVTRIADWHAKGLRVFQLQYGGHDGNQGPGEKLGGGNEQKGGLTELGQKVVRELARLKMVIDLSHCNEATILDTCEIARELGVPVTANHSGARGLKTADGRWRARYTRNMTDKAMLAIKSTGGVVAVMAYGPYLSGPYQKLRMSPPTRNLPHSTITDFVDHIEYMVNVMGPEHVGFSTDGYLDGTMAHARTADGVLDSPRRWKAAAQILHDRGMSDADLAKIIGGNFMRVYRKILGG